MCDNPAVRADELDEAVWQEVLALLENPELIHNEINRRIAAGNDSIAARRRTDTLHGEVARIATRLRRLLDAYQEEVITLDELRERRVRIPVDSDHPFHCIPITDSIPNRSAVPAPTDH